MTLQERFIKKIKYKNDCWLWSGVKDRNGYGCFYVKEQNGKYTHKRKYAHRISYEIYNGEFDKNMFVCHTCDTPSCVNPKHLFLGTPRDNFQDMFKKGRWKKPPVPNKGTSIILRMKNRIKELENIIIELKKEKKCLQEH